MGKETSGSAGGKKSAAGKSPRLIDVVLVPAELEKKDLTGKTAVVIDVLRATTTIVTAIDNGAAAVVAVLTPQEALAGRDAASSAALGAALGAGVALAGGERGGVALPGFDLGNSPLEYTPDRVGGRKVFLTTTNGTLALNGARRGGAARVAAASFLNAAAVAAWAAAAGSDVLLVGAGRRGQFSLEDTALAGLLAERIAASAPAEAGGSGGWKLSDAAEAARLVWRQRADDIAGLLRDSEHGRFLASIGLGADLDACARLDVTRTVPVLGDGRLAVGEAKEVDATKEGTAEADAAGAGIDRESLVTAVREAADDNRIPCTHAMALARRLRVPIRAVGDAANEAGVRIVTCQLGCFR